MEPNKGLSGRGLLMVWISNMNEHHIMKVFSFNSIKIQSLNLKIFFCIKSSHINYSCDRLARERAKRVPRRSTKKLCKLSCAWVSQHMLIHFLIQFQRFFMARITFMPLTWCTRFNLFSSAQSKSHTQNGDEVHGQSALFIPQCHLNGRIKPTFQGNFNESIQMSSAC